jgi:hypothetical protein
MKKGIIMGGQTIDTVAYTYSELICTENIACNNSFYIILTPTEGLTLKFFVTLKNNILISTLKIW